MYFDRTVRCFVVFFKETIIDFGLSRFVDGVSTMSTFAGAPYSMAPMIDFKTPEWENISKKAKGCITQLLKKDPSARMTATQAMEHPWLQTVPYKRSSLAGVVKTGDGEGYVINMQDIYRQLEAFACMREFHGRALYLMASELPEADIFAGCFNLSMKTKTTRSRWRGSGGCSVRTAWHVGRQAWG